jgi:alanine racemase
MTRQPSASNTRAWIEVDLGAVRRNGAAMRARARVPLLPMVKADAYGLGAIPVTRVLDALDPWGFGVATVAEGVELRDAGVVRPIIVFTPLMAADLPEAKAHRLTPTFGDAAAIAAWHALRGGPWHLAIDTGMSRAGVRWDALPGLAAAIAAAPPEGAFTHFHSADLDDGSLAEQERRFREALATLPAVPGLLHTENSAAIERRTPSPWSFARPGVFLYGVHSHPPAGSAPAPEQVAHLRARVVELREVHPGEIVSYSATWHAIERDGTRRIATLALGYADGYRRLLSNRGTVLIRGRRAPVVGVVTMDMTMVDVTGLACQPGDVATLMGRDGPEMLTTNDVADTAGMSPYELLTGMRGRLPRVYVGAEAV